TAVVDHPTVTTEMVVTSFTKAGVTQGGVQYNPFVEAIVGLRGTDSLGCVVAQLQDQTTQAQTLGVYAGRPADATAVSLSPFANNTRFRIYGSVATTLTCKFGATELPEVGVALGAMAPTAGFGVAKYLAAVKLDYVFVVGRRP
ncbi:MAG: hypothetical protein M3Y06_03410, partial [Actinomycetota bacterium]|nr:hypothetical protein [Actinomycetota bacterium]